MSEHEIQAIFVSNVTLIGPEPIDAPERLAEGISSVLPKFADHFRSPMPL